MHCRKCGKALPQDSSFCIHCSTKTEIVEEATPVSAAPEPASAPEPEPTPKPIKAIKVIDTGTQRTNKTGIMHWYFIQFSKYAVFSGRASRTEYWMFILWNFIIGMMLGAMEGFLGIFPESEYEVLSLTYLLAIACPYLAVSVRRLHDTGLSGWRMLITLVPFIGQLILLFWLIQDSDRDENQYGPNPKLEVP